jgi:putative Mg2+ transporter-C (MgtC) family protein
MPLVLYRLQSEDQEASDRVTVGAFLKSSGKQDELIEQIVTRLSLEPGVTAIRWEIVSAASASNGVASSGTPELEGPQA